MFSRFPTEPVTTSVGLGWKDLALVHHRCPATEVEEFAPDFHSFSVLLVGDIQLTRSLGGSRMTRRMRPHQLVLSPARSPLARRWNAPAEFIDVWLSEAHLKQVVDEEFEQCPTPFQLVDRFGIQDHVLEGIAIALLAEARNPGQATRLFAEGALSMLAVRIIQHHSTLSSPPPVHKVGLAPWRLKRVLEYIDATRDREVGLAELAGVAGLSPYHFARGFKQATGSTPHRFVLERRLEVATSLLANTDVRVGEVARRLGFSTTQHFSNAFRRVIGSTPRAYRDDRRR
jgi:AraC family transcriptional regulator